MDCQQQLQSDVDRISAQIAFLRKQTQTEDVKQQLMIAQSSYTDALSALTKQQKETEFYRTLETQARGDLLQLQAPYAAWDAEYWSNETNRNLERGRRWKNALNPFNHGGR